MSGVIRLQTEIPGPNSRALLARRGKAVPRGVPAVTPIAVVHADGAVLTDADGNRLIDFAGGIGVVNTGHRHPGVVQAVREQLDRFTHVCFPVSTYEPYVELAERLNRLTPGAHEKKTFFVNSGAEAVENAVKVARFYSGRQAVVGFEHGFHGRTNLAMALTSKVMPYKKGFGPFAPEVYRIPFPYCYRCGEARRGDSGTAGQCCMASRSRLEQIFASTVDPESVAAIIMELELGEGGFVPAPREYVDVLAEFARDHGILFIADEIQTGFGRTGTMFASEHYGLVPDIIITAKSLAGGLPLAAVTGRADVLDAPHVGGLGGTYGGNPLACAAALAVLNAMEEERIPARAQRTGDRIKARFAKWADQYPCIGDVRGLGAMVAMELVTDRQSRTPDKALTGRILAGALARGLVLLSAGTYGNVIRVLAPLTADDALIDEGLDVFGAALEAGAGLTPALA
ncbi:MAG: 4-aminobutyrate aminotransferase / (S)-3-amino-2-methylpropionate transaminase / 5-aminovalerate [Gemmatimonadales bacterium]|nr:4-aminobutyrate aminotransferase / (S)-3-amino-2-methylpropionate transaminase / 5-aminovalerate [Gemmatimonadales bacterium]